jgi:hypothetical protein
VSGSAHATSERRSAAALVRTGRPEAEREAEGAGRAAEQRVPVAGWSFASVSTTPPAGAAPPPDERVAGALDGPGRALDPPTRRAMEARFGEDLAGVRVHDDGSAAAAASHLGADAFALGEHVAFGPGRFDPAGAEGRGLLAHELAHVLQQRREGPRLDRQPKKKEKDAPTFSVSQAEYEGWVGKAIDLMTGRVPQASTFAPVVEPLLRSLASQLVWRDEKGADHGGGTYSYTVPGTKKTVQLRLVLDDMANPPEAGMFNSDGTKGTISVRVRQSSSPEAVTEVLYHESMHLMSWLIREHGGATGLRGEGIERRAVEGLDMGHYTREIGFVRKALDYLAKSVNSRRKPKDQIKPARLDGVARWLMEEVQVRAETEVLQKSLQVEAQRGASSHVYVETMQYGAINDQMVDSYVFDFSGAFVKGDRQGLTADDKETLHRLAEMLWGYFDRHVTRRFNFTAYTGTGPMQERPKYVPPPMTTPSLTPGIGGATREEPF